MRDGHEESVRRWLKRGDPIDAEPEPPLEAWRSVRRLAVEAAGSGQPALSAWRRRWLWGVPVAAALSIVLLLRAPAQRPAAEEAATVVARAQSAPAPAGREIQFVTSQGTLVVWVLDPRFNP
jgi:hypothetical protein